MPAVQPKVDVGSGTIIKLSIAATPVFEAEVLGLAWSGLSSEAIDITHMGTPPAVLPPLNTSFGSRIFMPGDHVDPGTIKVDCHHDPSLIPPVAALVDIEIEWPMFPGALTPTKWTGQGIGTAYESGAVLEGKMLASLTIKLSGIQEITQPT